MTIGFDLTPSRPLTPDNAVAALLHTTDGRYLLQHRDPLPTIFYPDHWGCFGGAIEANESPVDALRRELHEELSLQLDESGIQMFSRFQFSIEPIGMSALDRFYYSVLIDPEIVPTLRLGEGAEMALVNGRDALRKLRLVPYDAFALWLHCNQNMLVSE